MPAGSLAAREPAETAPGRPHRLRGCHTFPAPRGTGVGPWGARDRGQAILPECPWGLARCPASSPSRALWSRACPPSPGSPGTRREPPPPDPGQGCAGPAAPLTLSPNQRAGPLPTGASAPQLTPQFPTPRPLAPHDPAPGGS